MEDRLREFKEALLDNDYPLGIDEILGYVEALFEDDKDYKKIEKVMNEYQKSFSQLFNCAEKFYRVKDLVDEQFYSESEE